MCVFPASGQWLSGPPALLLVMLLKFSPLVQAAWLGSFHLLLNVSGAGVPLDAGTAARSLLAGKGLIAGGHSQRLHPSVEVDTTTSPSIGLGVAGSLHEPLEQNVPGRGRSKLMRREDHVNLLGHHKGLITGSPLQARLTKCPVVRCSDYNKVTDGCAESTFFVHANVMTIGFTVVLSNLTGKQMVRTDRSSEDGSTQVYFQNSRLVFQVAGNTPEKQEFSKLFTVGKPYEVVLTYNATSGSVVLFIADEINERKEFIIAHRTKASHGVMGCSSDSNSVLNGRIQDFYMIGDISGLLEGHIECRSARSAGCQLLTVQSERRKLRSVCTRHEAPEVRKCSCSRHSTGGVG